MIYGMDDLRSRTPVANFSLRPIILEHLSALLSTPTQYSILLIERAVVALLRLCRILAKEVCLDTLRLLTPLTHQRAAQASRSSIRVIRYFSTPAAQGQQLRRGASHPWTSLDRPRTQRDHPVSVNDIYVAFIPP